MLTSWEPLARLLQRVRGARLIAPVSAFFFKSAPCLDILGPYSRFRGDCEWPPRFVERDVCDTALRGEKNG